MEAHGNSLIHPSIDTHERKNAFKRCADVLQGGGALAIAQLNHVKFKKRSIKPPSPQCRTGGRRGTGRKP